MGIHSIMNLTQHSFKLGLHKETILSTPSRFRRGKLKKLPASNHSFKQLSIQNCLCGQRASPHAETEFPQASVLRAKAHF